MSRADDTAARRFLRWSLRGALAAVVLAYPTAIAYLMANEVSLVFVPPQTTPAVPPALAAGLEQLPRSLPDGARGRLWVLRQPATPQAPWAVYLHGNGATVGASVNVERYQHLRDLGLQVVAPEYPGYGGLPGVPSEQGLVAAARDAYAWLRSQGVAPTRIVIYGWSLGSGLATALASEVDERAVILEGAFTGVDDRAAELYPWLPIRLMIRTRFASRDRIGAIGSPLLLLHAADDTIVPYAHGQRLLTLAREPKTLVTLTGGHVHPNRADAARYLAAIRTFLATSLGSDAPAASR
ncbi:hypothetical protein TBR22_A20800 [Luteitalea sp. TBR-22]|uniref:alpha/beta hydrolase n=1 Tax=Luteitalea sp. TBR-22 TaxID=2802971 RepID=UPI001AF65B0C|nr:alpha/beta fold hydrolase [Luteitalea sp. TBR-22]BCS32856.1 hypothetical protein TBR22_A20800 [Luteitalea sp. TBR-22]